MMIHFILPGDTLENIAEKIKLENPVYVKEFHNTYCRHEDFIEKELVPGKKLLLPDLKKINDYNARNDAPFKSLERNPEIIFDPVGFSNDFKVKIKESTNDGGKIIENAFSYVASLQWIKNEFNEHLFHFSKDQFSNLHDTKMSYLAVESMNCLGSVEVYVNSKGELVRTAVKNKILNDLNGIMAKLYDLFHDKYAAIYLEEFKYVVQNPVLFDQKMKQDYFLKTYFSSFRNPFRNGTSFFEINFNSDSLPIQQTVNSLENQNEISLVQSLADDTQNDLSFTGNLTLSKDNGLIKNMNVCQSYKQYDIKYTTDFSFEAV
ncbi:hypothetical protein BA768_02345 [Chryseobacterium sp. CBo1]|uniref:hypothetical protein n=1 Tax=Chryseobacterium sp. CBo1 TaxID=1869230 RepID=UPI000810AA69|nr:hypothetical protein [Chryseobacterium sp. CBo1]OCK53400.1 hypothetical protein BA768_02345 [Chryseobacterium sp. CBo1]